MGKDAHAQRFGFVALLCLKHLLIAVAFTTEALQKPCLKVMDIGPIYIQQEEDICLPMLAKVIIITNVWNIPSAL